MKGVPRVNHVKDVGLFLADSVDSFFAVRLKFPTSAGSSFNLQVARVPAGSVAWGFFSHNKPFACEAGVWYHAGFDSGQDFC